MADEDAKLHIPGCSYKSTSGPPPEAYCSPMVTVVVGKNEKQKTFNLYKDVLAYHSSYFRSALREEWKEGQTKTISLTDDDPEVFQVFTYWLFSGRLHHSGLVARSSEDKKVSFDFKRICKIYVFGDMRGIAGLCNAALDVLFVMLHEYWTFPVPCLGYVYENTPEQSPIRLLLIEDALRWYNFNNMEQYPTDIPKEFLMDVVLIAQKEEKIPGFTMGKGSESEWISYMKASFCAKYHNHQTPAEVSISKVT